MARKKLVVRRSSSEAEDARWHHRHKRQLESEMERRLREGSALTLDQARARMKLRPVTIRLPESDIDAARSLAARKGIGYQTYIKMLLREALERESGGR